MINNTQAFILSYNKYKTSSIIASFLTKNSIIDAICYRAKKDSKAFGSDFESISKMQISLYQKKQPNLSILKESSIIKNYNLLEKSIYSSLAIFYIREVLLYSAKDFDERYFILMEKILNALEKLEEEKFLLEENLLKNYINILLRAFEMKVLYIAGISPQLDSCILCSSQKSDFYSIIEGGIICENCKINSKDAVKLEKGDIDFMRIIKKTSLIDIAQNKDINNFYINSITNVRDIMNKSLFNHLNKNFKSLKVLEEVLFN
ncbi:DNA repair protein RecO [Brachyspira sp.]|uniref:DNA repair protein RecO n=1 Tax=Brachyspira sp. TaxID=1977261 RepID=UPI003D7E7209